MGACMGQVRFDLVRGVSLHYMPKDKIFGCASGKFKGFIILRPDASTDVSSIPTDRWDLYSGRQGNLHSGQTGNLCSGTASSVAILHRHQASRSTTTNSFILTPLPRLPLLREKGEFASTKSFLRNTRFG